MGLEVQTRPVKKNWKEDVNDQERMFCDYILSGGMQSDAVFQAGYYPMEYFSDKAWRKKASNKAAELLKKKAIVIYMNKNKQRVIITDTCDSRALLRHMYDIAMGIAKSRVPTEDGKMVDVPPSFKEQVSAAKVFFAEDEKRQRDQVSGLRPVGGSGVSVIATETKKLLERFTLREVVTTDFYERHPEIEEEAKELANYVESDN